MNYYEDGRGNTMPVTPWNIFSDASFASVKDGFYSVSGMILCFEGTPILWKTAKQSILAQSTCEAEYIAAADALKAVERVGYLEFFRKMELSKGGATRWRHAVGGFHLGHGRHAVP